MTLPTVSVSDASVSLASGGSGTASFTVSLSAASTSPVTLTYSTADGTAHAGRDYQAASGTLTFAAGQTQKTIAVPVMGATTGDLAFQMNLSSPQGATAGDMQGTGTIHVAAPTPPPPPPPPPSSNVATFTDTSDWGSGFNGDISVKNTGTTPASGWTLSFDSPIQISSIWNAVIVSHAGNHYVIQNADWNGTLAAGIDRFGFTASPGERRPRRPTSRFSSPRAADRGAARRHRVGGTGGGGTTTLTARTTPLDDARPGRGRGPLANDQAPAGGTIAVASFTQGAHGNVSRNTNGTFRYTPAVGFSGSDVFTYTITDGLGDTATGTVRDRGGASTWPSQFYARTWTWGSTRPTTWSRPPRLRA